MKYHITQKAIELVADEYGQSMEEKQKAAVAEDMLHKRYMAQK